MAVLSIFPRSLDSFQGVLTGPNIPATRGQNQGLRASLTLSRTSFPLILIFISPDLLSASPGLLPALNLSSSSLPTLTLSSSSLLTASQPLPIQLSSSDFPDFPDFLHFAPISYLPKVFVIFGRFVHFPALARFLPRRFDWAKHTSHKGSKPRP